ncbi:MAG: GNAT family N-acetyltransferase [Gemmatimonadales bacterium]
MPASLAKRSWQTSRFNLLMFVGAPSSASAPTRIRFTGQNSLAQPGDAAHATLPDLYQGFAARGDAGVVASLDGRIVGWAWAREGPFVEPAGCGRIAFGGGQTVVQFFEVIEEHRGLGYGQLILDELTRRLIASSASRPVVAIVGVANEASRRCFVRSGYREVSRVSARRVLGMRPVSRVPAMVPSSADN